MYEILMHDKEKFKEFQEGLDFNEEVKDDGNLIEEIKPIKKKVKEQED